MKKQLTIVGTALAMLALSLIGATSASALPEFLVESGHTFPVTFTSESKTGVEPTLLSETGVTIVCSKSKDSGEITGAKSVAKVSVKYEGCKEGTTTKACTSPLQAKGVIVTKSLSGEIGYLNKSTTPPTVGQLLKPESGEFAEFTCEGSSFKNKVGGKTIGEAKPVNAGFKTTGELIYADNANNTAQQWTKFEGSAEEAVLTTELFGLKPKAWLMDTEVETFSAGVELMA